MDYKYNRVRDNGDATSDYNLIGTFPIKFIDFFNWVLKNENSFRIEFVATNECYGGWCGNKLEVSKDTKSGNCYWVGREPENWFEEIANKNVAKCWANGGWGQITYFCTFEEK